MMARTLVNLISLSRIPIALAFVATFKPHETLYYLSTLLCLAAFITDIADGYLARKLKVASVHGRQWDSLGDKAFYVAIIVSFLDNGLLSPLLGWGLLVREIALYITRVLYIEKLSKLEMIRPYTNWHGYFMYLTIILGFISMYGTIYSTDLNIIVYIQICAMFSLAFGVASIAKFLSL